MVAVDVPRASVAPDSGRGGYRLSRRASFVLLVSMAVTFLAASNVPTPLYPVYQEKWGFSAITTTIVFSLYAAAVLVALLTIGSLSDYIGRKPMLYAALASQAGALLLFAFAPNVATLAAARIVQGISTGAAMGALGAGLLDLDKLRGATAGAVAPMIGTGLGAEVSGLFVQWLPAPTHLIYLVLLAGFVLQTVGVACMPETVAPRPGARKSLRPRFALPPAVRKPMIAAAPAMVACWSMGGLYGSLGPALVQRITGTQNHVLGGSALFVLAVSGGVGVLALKGTSAETMMVLGIASLFLGVGLTLFAAHYSAAGFFLAAVVAGVGFGAAFQGALRSIVAVAEPHERAGVLSVLFVISYVAFGGPAILAGIAVVGTGDIMATAQYYGAAVMVFAAFALFALLRRVKPAE